MFKLETAIAAWRQKMQVAGIQSSELLDELESHLREDIEQQMSAGVDAERAFKLAVQHVGEAIPIKKEFMKTGNATHLFLQKLKAFVLGVRNVPLPTLDNFEPAARQTLDLAPEEARHFNHNFVGTEHLLLGLTRSGSRTVLNVLQQLGVSPGALRVEIERLVPTGPLAIAVGQIPYTPRARQALQLSTEEARKLNQSRVRPEHIFLGLLGEGGGVAALVLKKLGVQLEAARAEVLKEMAAHPEAG